MDLDPSDVAIGERRRSPDMLRRPDRTRISAHARRRPR